MKRIFVFFAFLIVAVMTMAGCSRPPQKIRIAVDSNWYPLNFQDKQYYINGFVDELLLEISKHSNVEFQKINANWDSLFEGLKQHRYDAVLSSLPPYPFNLAKYDFSGSFLDIGPVLVTPIASSWNNLSQMANGVVGVLPSNQEWFVMQKYSDVIMRTFDSVPEIFNALNNSEVEGIVIDRLIAIGFVKGTFAGKLKISYPPLTNAGLRLITLKDDPVQTVQMFDKNLRYLLKKKKFHKLLQKWELDV